MKLDDFDYHLPPNFIARYPPPKREDARLLHLPRENEALAHLKITDLPRFLRPRDLLVINDTKVNPWRIHGRRKSGGRVEVLLLKQLSPGKFRAMVRANRPCPKGKKSFSTRRAAPRSGRRGWKENSNSPPRMISPNGWNLSGRCRFHLTWAEAPRTSTRSATRPFFARNPGAVAAPTAGLHLSEKMLEEVSTAGARIARLTLHVGAGTFRPVHAENIEEHEMDAESYILTEETVASIHEAKSGGGAHPGRGHDGGPGAGIRIYRGDRARPHA